MTTAPNTAYKKRWNLDRAMGRNRMTAARPVRVHIDSLVAQRMSLRAIAECAGVSTTAVSSISRGRQASVRVPIARALLAVTPEAALHRARGTGFVLAVGARRRVAALLALGHRHAEISAAMGAAYWGTSANVLNHPGGWIARETHDAVVRAYEALSMTPGVSAHTRGRALRAGFAPPLAWDDADIDDPNAAPATDGLDGDGYVDEVAVARALAGDRPNLTRAERLAALPVLVGRGWSDLTIGDQLGVTSETVLRDRQFLGLGSRWSA